MGLGPFAVGRRTDLLESFPVFFFEREGLNLILGKFSNQILDKLKHFLKQTFIFLLISIFSQEEAFCVPFHRLTPLVLST